MHHYTYNMKQVSLEVDWIGNSLSNLYREGLKGEPSREAVDMNLRQRLITISSLGGVCPVQNTTHFS